MPTIFITILIIATVCFFIAINRHALPSSKNDTLIANIGGGLVFVTYLSLAIYVAVGGSK